MPELSRISSFLPKISSERIPHESGLRVSTFFLSMGIISNPIATNFDAFSSTKKRFVLRRPLIHGCNFISRFLVRVDCHVSVQGGGSVIQVCGRADGEDSTFAAMHDRGGNCQVQRNGGG
jgi:hypothetical protein